MTAPANTSVVTAQTIRIAVRPPDEEWVGQYTHLQIWRSRVGKDGPYEELTGPYWMPAELFPTLVPAPGLAPLVGKSIDFLVNDSTKVSITFTGADPLTVDQIAAQITNSSHGVLTGSVFFDVVGVFCTSDLGVGNSITCLGGDASTTLGFSTQAPDSTANGNSPRLPLVPGGQLYTLDDLNGDPTWWYRTRYSNAQTRAVSAFSDPIPALPTQSVDPSSTCIGYLDGVDGFGRSLAGRTVLIYFPNQYITAQGKNILGSQDQGVTDANGHYETTLVRGLSLRVAIAGTDLIREVVVPVDPTINRFNLFDPQYGTDDVSKVQVPNLPYASRRTV